MPNQAIRNMKGDIKVEAKVEIVGTTSEPEVIPVPTPAPLPEPVVAAPTRPAFNTPLAPITVTEPVCEKCGGSKRVIFTEKQRGLKSVGPCECVKA